MLSKIKVILFLLGADIKTDATTWTLKKFRRLIMYDFWGGQSMPLKLDLKYHEKAGTGVRLGNFVIAVVWGSLHVQHRMTSNLWPFCLSLLSTGINKHKLLCQPALVWLWKLLLEQPQAFLTVPHFVEARGKSLKVVGKHQENGFRII